MRNYRRGTGVALAILLCTGLAGCNTKVAGFTFQSQDVVATLSDSDIAAQALECKARSASFVDSWKNKLQNCDTVLAKEVQVKKKQEEQALAAYKEKAASAQKANLEAYEKHKAEAQAIIDKLVAFDEAKVKAYVATLLADKSQIALLPEDLEKSISALKSPTLVVGSAKNVREGQTPDSWTTNLYYVVNTEGNAALKVAPKTDVSIADLSDMDVPTNGRFVADYPIKEYSVKLVGKGKKPVEVAFKVMVQVEGAEVVASIPGMKPVAPKVVEQEVPSAPLTPAQADNSHPAADPKGTVLPETPAAQPKIQELKP